MPVSSDGDGGWTTNESRGFGGRVDFLLSRVGTEGSRAHVVSRRRTGSWGRTDERPCPRFKKVKSGRGVREASRPLVGYELISFRRRRYTYRRDCTPY